MQTSDNRQEALSDLKRRSVQMGLRNGGRRIDLNRLQPFLFTDPNTRL
jgi:hypothetical protein